ncbi:zonadhesin-like [Stegostoma tigrinum]|uniref:zonadhesin-like n=1 Tax=Stegostoma tigrinum TaxID=3053191 RepID=UPI00202AFBA5|nr:zonadhesin-like [Stegostoma tigrinum]
MAEENSILANSVEADGIVTNIYHPELDNTEGVGDSVQTTEEKLPTGELKKFLLTETMTNTEGAKFIVGENSSDAEMFVTNTEKTNSTGEDSIPAAETILCISETSSLTAKVNASAEEITLPAQKAIPSDQQTSSPREENIPTADTISSIEVTSSPTEKLHASAQETSSQAWGTIPCTEETNSPREGNILAAETSLCINEMRPSSENVTEHIQEINSSVREIIPCIEKTISSTEQVIRTTQKIHYLAEEIIPCTEAYVLSEMAIWETSTNKATPFEKETSFPTELNEKINQATDEIDSPTEENVCSTGRTIIPTVFTIQDVNPESELVTSCSPIKQDTTVENRPLEIYIHGERTEAVSAGKEVMSLSTGEVYKENGTDRNVKDPSTDNNDDDAGAEEEIYSEFQQGNESSGSPSTSSILSSQPESPFNVDSAEDHPGSSRRLDITKHSYSRYNTVSYRKIKKGNTKQRIDEFESMLNIN